MMQRKRKVAMSRHAQAKDHVTNLTLSRMLIQVSHDIKQKIAAVFSYQQR